MPLTDSLTKLDNIAKLPGKNDKRALLKSYLDNSVFAKVMALMFSEDQTFHIKKLPPHNSPATAGGSDQIFYFLEKLAGQRGASALDKSTLAELAGNGATREVVSRILTGKSKAGFTATSVNKARPGMIFQTPYQRCASKGLEKVSLPGLVQKKADGMFSYASLIFSKTFLTRRGKSHDIKGSLDDEITMYFGRLPEKFSDPVFVGELTLIEANGSTMPRKKGNGILNKFIKGTGNIDLAKQVVYTVWDVLPGADFKAGISDIPYGERWAALEKVFALETSAEEAALFMRNKIEGCEARRVTLIETEKVTDLKQARAFYKRMRNAGEEGAILKDLGTIWKSNTAPTSVKMKHFTEAEFKITGVNEGQNKYKGMMGSLTVSSYDGGVVSNVGSGFTDAERDMKYWESHIGDVITVQFESLITDKKREGVKSLFLPTFVEVRFDEKDEADTTAYMEVL